VIDALEAANDNSERPKRVGKVTHYLSWTWIYRASVFISAIRQWVQTNKLDPEKTFIWCCFFCNDQWENQDLTTEKLEETFDTKIACAGHMITMLDTWENPANFTRVWCVYEQYLAIRHGIPVDTILPKKGEESFEEELEKGKEGLKRVMDGLNKIDVEQCVAYNERDQELLKEKIRESPGFKYVDDTVRRGIMDWCTTRLRGYFENQLTTNLPSDQEGAPQANSTRA